MNVDKLNKFRFTSNVNRYCGSPGLKIAQFILNNSKNEWIQYWFPNRTAILVYKGRVAICYAAGLVLPTDGGEILIPSYNCGSEIDALIKSGCTIITYRIDRRVAIDLQDLEKKITIKTKAIYVTHYFGFPSDIEIIRALCDDRGIYLIEDCALSLFSMHNSRKLGTFGDVAILSFPKTLPVPDGGALVINNPAIVSCKWQLRNPKLMPVEKNLLPLVKATVLRYLSHGGANSIVDAIARRSATNRIPTDQQMRQMPESYFFDETIRDTTISFVTRRLLNTFSPEEIVRQRRANYLSFLEVLKDTAKVKPLYRELPPGVCPLSFPIIVPERNRVYAKLTSELIAVIPWWAGYHPGLPWNDFPDACFLKDNLLTLPVHQQLNRDDILYIADRLLKTIA